MRKIRICTHDDENGNMSRSEGKLTFSMKNVSRKGLSHYMTKKDNISCQELLVYLMRYSHVSYGKW